MDSDALPARLARLMHQQAPQAAADLLRTAATLPPAALPDLADLLLRDRANPGLLSPPEAARLTLMLERAAAAAPPAWRALLRPTMDALGLPHSLDAGADEADPDFRRLFPELCPPIPPAAAPLQIFILGPARSGTSALCAALAQVFNLPGQGESHVMPLFQRLLATLGDHLAHYATMPDDITLRRVESRPVELLLQAHLRAFYRAVHGGTRFIDKTPTAEAIRGAPLIAATFPDAHILVTRRSGIEVVLSHQRKFASSFAAACAAWAEAMTAIRDLRARALPITEIDQHDMATDPRGLATRLAETLARPEAAPALAAALAGPRVERSAPHPHPHPLLLQHTGWTEEEKSTFLQTCGPLMTAFGYRI